MKDKILFQKDKFIVGIDGNGQMFESYGNTYSRNILGGAALYINELKSEIKRLNKELTILRDEGLVTSS